VPCYEQTAVCTFAWILSLLIFCCNVVTASCATGIRIDVAGISVSYCGECRTRDKLKQVLEPAFEITHVASGNVNQCRSDIRPSFLLHSNCQLLTITSWNEDDVLFSWTTLNVEATGFSETSVSVCKSARRHVPETWMFVGTAVGTWIVVFEWGLNSGTVVLHNCTSY